MKDTKFIIISEEQNADVKDSAIASEKLENLFLSKEPVSLTKICRIVDNLAGVFEHIKVKAVEGGKYIVLDYKCGKFVSLKSKGED